MGQIIVHHHYTPNYSDFKFATDGKYEGDIVNGKKHGTGEMRYTNGNTYSGEWQDDKKNGLGGMYYADGCSNYEGSWKNDEYEHGVLLNRRSNTLTMYKNNQAFHVISTK